MNWLRHDFSLRSMKVCPAASRPRAFIMPPHPLQAVPLPLKGKAFGNGRLPPPFPPFCHPDRAVLPPLSSRPSAASGGIWEPTPLYKRFLHSVAAASSVEMTGKTLASTVAKQNWQRNGFLPPPLRSNGGGGILPSGQNDGRGGPRVRGPQCRLGGKSRRR